MRVTVCDKIPSTRLEWNLAILKATLYPTVYFENTPTQKDVKNGYFVRHKPTGKKI